MNYVYSGRLQPLSKLNEEEFLWICNNIQDDDKLIIGIVNPNPTFLDPSDLALSWTRFKPEFNPLTYWERFEMVSEFIKRCGISDKVAAVIPLPRPSTNMQRAANYLPKDRVMCLSIVQDNDQEESKELGMTSQGETIKKIPAYTFGNNYTIISPELIFCLIAINNNKWKELVAPSVCHYLESLNISSRVMAKLNRNEAMSTIRRIYKRTSNDNERIAIYNIISEDFPDLTVPMPSHFVDHSLDTEISVLRQMIENLYIEIISELPMLHDAAPQQFSVFNADVGELNNVN